MPNRLQIVKELHFPLKFIFVLLLFYNVPCLAQTVQKDSVKHLCSYTFKVVPVSGQETAKEQFKLYGTVTDEQLLAIPNVEIRNKRLYKARDTYNTGITDFDGSFFIDAAIGDTVTIQLAGMVSQYIVVKNQDKLSITLREPIVYDWQPPLMRLPKKDVINVAPISAEMIAGKKRTFLGRVFYGIGYIFRKDNNYCPDIE